MIIVRLMGGLGNQMFQYALGRSLAIKHGMPLLLDKSFYADEHGVNVTVREYDLGHFKIRAVALPDTIARLVSPDRNSGMPRLLERWTSRAFGLKRETSMRFDPSIFLAPGKTIFEGYWQSEKYFDDIRDFLLAELVPRMPLSSGFIAATQEIKLNDLASIHVRRGDYVTNATAAAYHGTCSIEWYKAAVAAVEARAGVRRFLVFGDDLDWARENLRFLAEPIFADEFDLCGAWEDLYLMSHCRHNIIANSSFSWWAAWLNRFERKIIVAPRKWFVDESDLRDRIPGAWVLV
ncbi:alpha-1,2-fucosyltransferase [Methylobacterium phyllosphaerae]